MSGIHRTRRTNIGTVGVYNEKSRRRIARITKKKLTDGCRKNTKPLDRNRGSFKQTNMCTESCRSKVGIVSGFQNLPGNNVKKKTHCKTLDLKFLGPENPPRKLPGKEVTHQPQTQFKSQSQIQKPQKPKSNPKIRKSPHGGNGRLKDPRLFRIPKSFLIWLA